MPNALEPMIANAFRTNAVRLPPGAESLFERYLSLFLEYNAHTNLSAIRDAEGVVEKHFADSAILSKFETLSGRLLDIGTGGGFPGIPLKILFPELEVTLLDSVGKKAKACEYFVAELGLPGVSCVWARAEELAHRPGMRASFDSVVSRATAYLPKILEWSVPFLQKNGRIFLYKTPSEEEFQDGISAAKKLGLILRETHCYELSGQDRKIFVFAFK
jgi:16S rRNA (guanine527-N7)-methyltransferase